jgi:hypothetical protein
LVKYSVSKLGNRAWETRNIRIRAMPYVHLKQGMGFEGEASNMSMFLYLWKKVHLFTFYN